MCNEPHAVATIPSRERKRLALRRRHEHHDPPAAAAQSRGRQITVPQRLVTIPCPTAPPPEPGSEPVKSAPGVARLSGRRDPLLRRGAGLAGDPANPPSHGPGRTTRLLPRADLPGDTRARRGAAATLPA